MACVEGAIEGGRRDSRPARVVIKSFVRLGGSALRAALDVAAMFGPVYSCHLQRRLIDRSVRYGERRRMHACMHDALRRETCRVYAT